MDCVALKGLPECKFSQSLKTRVVFTYAWVRSFIVIRSRIKAAIWDIPCIKVRSSSIQIVPFSSVSSQTGDLSSGVPQASRRHKNSSKCNWPAEAHKNCSVRKEFTAQCPSTANSASIVSKENDRLAAETQIDLLQDCGFMLPILIVSNNVRDCVGPGLCYGGFIQGKSAELLCSGGCGRAEASGQIDQECCTLLRRSFC